MPQLTWDSILLVMLVGGMGLGFLLRKAKIFTYIIAIYLAYIFSNELGLWITRGIRAFLNFDVNIFYLKFVLYILLSGTLMTEEYILSNQINIPVGVKTNFEGAFYGFLFSSLFISNIFTLMDGNISEEIQRKSIMASYIIVNRIFIVVIPILIISISSLFRRFKLSS